MLDGTIRVFISYSHDSEVHVQRVLAFAQRLRDDGIDVSLDQFIVSPPEGWPAWMHRQIQEAKFVVVMCSPGYVAKIDRTNEPNRGLGVKWEGAIITDALYEEGGRNVKFIPVVASEEDAMLLPYFLRSATRYNISDERSFLALYRHLTDQPRVQPRPIGSLRVLPSDTSTATSVSAVGASATSEDLEPVLLFSPTAGVFVIPARAITVTDTVDFDLAPAGDEASYFLGELAKSANYEVAVAYGSQAALCNVVSVKSVRRGGRESVALRVRAIESDYGTMLEMTTSGPSAESIAEMRARRILLDERLAKPLATGDDPATGLSNAMFEVLVRGVNVPLEVHESPLPDLFEMLRGDPEEFLRNARLVSVLYLRLSGTVEKTTKLALSLDGQILTVDFEGLRAKKYSNREPHRIAVSGSLVLTRPVAG